MQNIPVQIKVLKYLVCGSTQILILLGESPTN
jgi:hypothetical protein